MPQNLKEPTTPNSGEYLHNTVGVERCAVDSRHVALLMIQRIFGGSDGTGLRTVEEVSGTQGFSSGIDGRGREVSLGEVDGLLGVVEI